MYYSTRKEYGTDEREHTVWGTRGVPSFFPSHSLAPENSSSSFVMCAHLHALALIGFEYVTSNIDIDALRAFNTLMPEFKKK